MQEPEQSTPVVVTPVKRRFLRVSRRVALASGVAVLAGGGAYYWWSTRPIIDQSVVSSANFSVYAPKKVPQGYTLQEERTNLGGNTLTYSFSNSTNSVDKAITVTVQPKPAGFDMSQMTDGGSINSTATSNGTLYNLSAGGRGKYLLDTGESLVFLTSPTTIDTATVNSIANSLDKLN